MGKRLNIVFDDDVEALLRNHIHKKGDLSRIVNEAVREKLKVKEQ